jgi:hypothetical protein
MSPVQKEAPPTLSSRVENVLVDQVREILLQLTKAISSIKVFSWQHAATRKMIHGVWENLARFLEKQQPRLDIGVEEFAFTFHDRVVYRDERAIKSLPFLFYKDGMKQLFIYKSLKEEELSEFLKIICDAFELPEEADVVNRLWEKDLAHIHCFAPDDFLEAKIGAGKQPPMMYSDPSKLRMGIVSLNQEDLAIDGSITEAELNLAIPSEIADPALVSPDESGIRPVSDGLDAEPFTLLSDQEDRDLREMLQFNRRLSPTGEMVLLEGELLHLETDPTRFLQIMEVVDRLHQDLIEKADFYWAAQLLEHIKELQASFLKDSSPSSFQLEPLQEFLDKVSSRFSQVGIQEVLAEKPLSDYRSFFDYLTLVGPKSLPLLTDLCDVIKSPAFYAAMGGYLREIGRQAPSQLLQLATSSRPALTKEVIAALGSHPDKRVVLLLAAFKGAWDSSIKQEAIRFLGKSTDPGAIRILSDFMKDPDEDIRVFTANSIMTLNDKVLGDHVKSTVLNKNFYKKSLAERQAYLDLLGRQLNWEAYDVLRDILRQRSGLVNRRRRLDTRLAVVQTLARTGGSRAREVLQDGCHMRGLAVRRACRIALESLPRLTEPKTPPPEKKDARA